MQAFENIRDPLIGTRIDDRYLVQGVLGRGGMGVVYDGVHEQLGRPVAIKVLGAGVAGDRTAVERFLREARTASRLTHGNIVDVSDLGQLPDGRPYLVMAKMSGIDLCTMLQKHGPQTPRRTAELLRGAAAALDLIHAKGFVHRDVKPENLMHVLREDGSEAVLLLDFGIVGLVSGPGAARLTADGSVFGTPAYLAPEVINGSVADRRADVYALATVAFELITGRAPFVAANVLKILPMKLMQEAPRMGDVCHFVFSEPLEAAIAKGLAREPVRRFASAGAFLSALDAAAGERAASPLRAALSPTPEYGLDPASRERLRRASTADLEMPIGYSAPPPSAADEASLARFSEEAADTERVSGPAHERARVFEPTIAIPKSRAPGWFWLLAGALGLIALSAFALRTMREPTPVIASAPAVLAPAAPPPAAPAAPPPAASAPVVMPPHVATLPEPAASVPAPHHHAHAEPAAVPAKPAAAPSAGEPSAAELAQAAQRELLLGHMSAAVDLYSQATRVDPRDHLAWRGLGLANERLGRTSEAVRAFRRALALAPGGPNADALRAKLEKLGAP
jgi:eukaryotic-like serine/threonine-protein kinase